MDNKKLNYPPCYYEDIPDEMFAFVEREEIKDEVFKTKQIGFFKDMLIRLCKNKASVAAFVVICCIAMLAAFAPYLNNYTMSQQFYDYRDMPPRIPLIENFGIFNGTTILKNRNVSELGNEKKYPNDCIVKIEKVSTIRGVEIADVRVNYYKYVGAEDYYFWFGTDSLGRDLWTRTWEGTRVSLIIAFAVVLANVFIGIVYGAIAGYYGGTADMLMMRFCEILRALPEVVVVTMFLLMFGDGMGTIILAMVIRGWVPTARMIRAQFLRFKGREYVMAARTMGVPDRKIIFRHILPNSIGPIITRAMMSIPNAIFTESFLAFIGLGLRPPQPSLGTLLAAGHQTLLVYPTQTLFPAVIISVLMIAFNLFSNGLRDAFDPTQRGVG